MKKTRWIELAKYYDYLIFVTKKKKRPSVY